MHLTHNSPLSAKLCFTRRVSRFGILDTRLHGRHSIAELQGIIRDASFGYAGYSKRDWPVEPLSAHRRRLLSQPNWLLLQS